MNWASNFPDMIRPVTGAPESQLAELLQLLVATTTATLAQFVPNGPGEVLTWWAATPDHPVVATESAAVPEPEQGWDELTRPVRADDRPLGVLRLARPGPARSWAAADRTSAGFAAQVLALLLRPRPAAPDELTGLDSMREFMALRPEGLGWRPDEQVALYALDLDRFKSVNDVFGYAPANELLRAVGRRLLDWVGPNGRAARAGGAVFLAVRPEPDSDLTASAERLRELIGQPVLVDGVEISRSASVGASMGRLPDTSVVQLLTEADHALQAARTTTGNEARIFDDELRARAIARAEIEVHLRTAVRSGALLLEYQPEFDLRTGALLAFEALVRWQHPVLGLLAPDEFIDVAEQTNMLGELSVWVLREACRQRGSWQRDHPNLPLVVRVNMSPVQLVVDGLVDLVRDALAANGLVGAQLCIEVTERAVPPDIPRTAEVLRQLRAVGVETALDDFGTGHNSLSRLAALPVDALKIDRSFTAGLGENRGNTAIVEALARLAQIFELDLIAEGVETLREAAELLRVGCYRAQGHLLGAPASPETLEPLLRAGRLDPDVLNFGH